jgi:hypothetical protein
MRIAEANGIGISFPSTLPRTECARHEVRSSFDPEVSGPKGRTEGQDESLRMNPNANAS